MKKINALLKTLTAQCLGLAIHKGTNQGTTAVSGWLYSTLSWTKHTYDLESTQRVENVDNL